MADRNKDKDLLKKNENDVEFAEGRDDTKDLEDIDQQLDEE